MRNTPTLEEKMAKYKDAFSSSSEAEVIPKAPSLPENKLPSPGMKFEEKSSASISMPKKEKLVNIPDSTSQRYLEFVPLTARLKGEHVDFLARITRKINQERRINATSIKNSKRERITEQSVLRALLDVCMSQIDEKLFDAEVVLNEAELKSIVRSKLEITNSALM
ncbi:MAG: hypothetical protein COW00_18695 [Bdellovibrio sp. CG12_big_fil_rev_8_21_14_0_65_39_13]|nr:MAG: hypothetical protein COW78_10700 [Bdellovibrio sp. CG22_combo_CG10-13_8_21_14_all_39_27]PIQ57845.1 MAG: hypothetical protein COW00_18695 [Bdellovibrio sp. CG12_big_fil_rev_8_21_14_0_65_39_13]PIR36120.1 MAG: hypothetical protein COV37_05080 [Bdellovibrio sp. CG11_big_fil_rev_8_21_14_0_20_39_38]PJB52471.1 MAG: hypothetical protein CO099_12460 [Bdellovibrio sp. CG_4_9_14_3_um_filter_39_7]